MAAAIAALIVVLTVAIDFALWSTRSWSSEQGEHHKHAPLQQGAAPDGTELTIADKPADDAAAHTQNGTSAHANGNSDSNSSTLTHRHSARCLAEAAEEQKKQQQQQVQAATTNGRTSYHAVLEGEVCRLVPDTAGNTPGAPAVHIALDTAVPELVRTEALSTCQLYL
jgi:hypothetical protein